MSAEHIGFPWGAAPPRDQDAVDEVADCVAVICSYGPGQRTDYPEFGARPNVQQQGGVDLDQLAARVGKFEARQPLTLTGNDPVLLEGLRRANVTIQVGGSPS